MTIIYHNEIEQGSDEWLALRCGILTASEIKHIITPAELKPVQRKSKDDRHKFAKHVYDIAAQRLTGFVEPSYVSSDMLRGMCDEVYAIDLYDKKISQVERIGFITNDKFGFTMGFSPDGLTHGRKKGIECKSRSIGYQIEAVAHKEIDKDFLLQLQTGMMVAELESIDFISYAGGMHMLVMTAYPDDVIQSAILEAAKKCEDDIKKVIEMYADVTSELKLIKTERIVQEEMR